MKDVVYNAYTELLFLHLLVIHFVRILLLSLSAINHNNNDNNKLSYNLVFVQSKYLNMLKTYKFFFHIIWYNQNFSSYFYLVFFTRK